MGDSTKNREGDWGLIEADATVLRPDEGGRETPIFTGYRPNWQDAGTADLNRGLGFVEVIGADELEPGSTGIIIINTAPRSLWLGLQSESRLDMCEGPKRVVARVTVRRVLREPTVDW
jgi:hypothetical protein